MLLPPSPPGNLSYIWRHILMILVQEERLAIICTAYSMWSTTIFSFPTSSFGFSSDVGLRENAWEAAVVLMESRSQLTCVMASGRFFLCVLKTLKAAFWKDFKEMMSLVQQLGVWSFLWERNKAFHIKGQLKLAAQYFWILIQIW